MRILPQRFHVILTVLLILIFTYDILGTPFGFAFFELRRGGDTLQRKDDLIDYYWKTSKKLFDEGLYSEALFQAQRIRELAPHNKKAIALINAIREKRNGQAAWSAKGIDEERALPAAIGTGGYAAGQRGTGRQKFLVISDTVVREQESVRGAISTRRKVISEEADIDARTRALAEKVSRRKTAEIKSVQHALELGRAAYKKKRYLDALFYFNHALAWDPQNLEALEYKNAILREKRTLRELTYDQTRKLKAQLFRETNLDEDLQLSRESMRALRDQERLRKRQETERLKAERRREELAEAQIRQDVRQRIMREEQTSLDEIIKAVEESKFYKKFEDYDRRKREAKELERRQIHSFLLRAEGLMEMGRYEEALVYINNVFMLAPNNSRAQKLRVKLEDEQFKKRLRDERRANKLFEQEKREYERIRKEVRKQKVRDLMWQAKQFYKDEEWLKARQSVQKVLIIDPSNKRAQRLRKKTEKKLETLHEAIRTEEELLAKKKSGAMETAFQEAARALELELIKEKKGDIEIGKRVAAILANVDQKITVTKQYDEALVLLNQAYVLDAENKTIKKKIKEVQALQQAEAAGLTEKKPSAVEEKEKPITEEVAEVITVAPEEKKAEAEAARKAEAEAKEARLREFNRGKQILSAAARKNYREKVNRAVRNAQYHLDTKEFDKAKQEIERIFLFDPKNPTAKDLLARITEYEVVYEKKKEATMEEEFQRGLEIEKLKVALEEEVKEKDIIRQEGEAQIEDEKLKKKTIKKLFKEGKKLYKQKRYYEAINKFEAIFALDAQHKAASEYIDKVKDQMFKERDKERKLIKAEQQEKINATLDDYSKEVRHLQQRGRYTESAIIIEKALLLDPANKYFKELKKMNERGASEQMLREATPAEEKRNLINAGIKEYIKGNYTESKKYFEEVLTIDPNDEKAHNSIKKIEAKLNSLK